MCGGDGLSSPPLMSLPAKTQLRKQMQPVWLCILSGKRFENTQWGKVKLIWNISDWLTKHSMYNGMGNGYGMRWKSPVLMMKILCRLMWLRFAFIAIGLLRGCVTLLSKCRTVSVNFQRSGNDSEPLLGSDPLAKWRSSTLRCEKSWGWQTWADEISERQPAVAVNGREEAQTEATHPQRGSLTHRRVISQSANTLPDSLQCERTWWSRTRAFSSFAISILLLNEFYSLNILSGVDWRLRFLNNVGKVELGDEKWLLFNSWLWQWWRKSLQ